MSNSRPLAVSLFNHVWGLLDNPERTTEQDFEMIHAAHASRHHWAEAGGPLEVARGEWQISRVYAVLGLSESALLHGKRYLTLVEQHDLPAFDRGYAYEALARVALMRDQLEAAHTYIIEAEAQLATLTDEHEAEFLRADLKELSAELKTRQ